MYSGFKNIFQTKSLNGMMASVYQGIDFSLEGIKTYLNGFPGGRVDVNLNDESGIAIMCLNHPEKKNAISGNIHVS